MHLPSRSCPLNCGGLWPWEMNHRLALGWCLVAKSCLTLATPWAVARQAPLSIQPYKRRLSNAKGWGATSTPCSLAIPGLIELQ